MKDAPNRTDAEPIVASRKNPDAFRELNEQTASLILAYTYRRTLDPQVTADLATETSAIAFEKRFRYRPRQGSRPGLAVWDRTT